MVSRCNSRQEQPIRLIAGRKERCIAVMSLVRLPYFLSVIRMLQTEYGHLIQAYIHVVKILLNRTLLFQKRMNITVIRATNSKKNCVVTRLR